MDEQREVVLPCGHQYLGEGLGITVLTCPICNVSHTVDLHNAHALPFELDLQEPRACPVHGDPIRMWCQDCLEPACGLCAFDKHPMQSHSLMLAVTFISRVRKDVLAHSHRMLRQTTRGMDKNENSFYEFEDKLQDLFDESKALHQLASDLRTLIPAVESASGVRTLHEADKELKRIQAKAWTVSVIEEDTDEGASLRAQGRGDDLSSTVGSFGLWANRVSEGRARLTWDADKLLLCAFSGPTPHPQPVLQLLAMQSLGSPEFPEVFLELSVGTHLLGIVYIKLWGHLRRAQNFMLLCLGTLGPSFIGSTLLPVTMKGTASESIGAGMYRDAKGDMTAMPLLTALEWGGEYQTSMSKGLLVAGSGGKKKVDSLYNIITGTGTEGDVCQCKFGWVSSGLEYVKKATLYDPVQVRVSQCGIVLPQRT